jgi:RND superfamily putative drug exporter
MTVHAQRSRPVLERLGHFLVRRRWFVLAGTLIVIMVSGAIGGNVADHLKAGGFDSPDVESQRASDLLGKVFKQSPPNFLLLVTAKTGTVDAGPAHAGGVAVTNSLLGEKDVSQILSAFALPPGTPLESRDHKKAIVVAQIAGSETHKTDVAERLSKKYTLDTAVVSVRVGGFEAVFKEVSDTIEHDLSRAESIAIPITLVLLIVFFGSVVAASLPLGVGILSILGTFLVLRLISSVTNVSVFALSMVTAMGLGLAIDYSLFIVSRFREEMHKGADTETALVTTMRTAGRTIIFSGITVAVSLSALLVFPLYFFKSFGYAGIGVVLTAVLGAVLFLPALLAVLGPRVDKWALWRRHPKEVGEGYWHRLAVFVMHRPIPIAVVVTIILLVLGIPFLHANLGLPDERVLPPSAKTRQVHDAIRRDFSSEEVQSIRIVAPQIGNPIARRADVARYAAAVSTIPGVDHVDTLTGEYAHGKPTKPPSPISARFASADSVWFQVVPAVDPFSKDAESIVHSIRDADPIVGGRAPFHVQVGGSSAQLVDAKHSLFSRLPIAIAIIAIATFVLLFLMFGSLLVPAKALVLNFLSLTATFGAMVWIFQEGHLSGFLNFTSTGTLDISSPILMFCIAFGLSMDYEVFLLSRIKEEYDHTGNNAQSVAIGLERTGPIITAAAVLISVVFLSFGTSSVRFIKLFGIGMALAVLMDAFVIRGTLVPAFMRLAGRANWWLPSFLKPLYARVHINEMGDTELRAGPTAPAPSRPQTPRKSAPKKAPPSKAGARKAAPKKATSRKKPAAKRKPAKR